MTYTSCAARSLAVSMLASACTPQAARPEPPLDLTAPEAWTHVAMAGDPWPSHRPTEVRCDELGAYPEGGSYEIDTGSCNYLSVVQPIPMELLAGDRVRIALTHGDLLAESPGEGHVAMQIGDELLWSELVSIPATATPYSEDLVLTHDHPLDTQIWLHIHNHGANNWRLIYVRYLGPTQ